jgi:hypothetical protein
MNMGGYSVWDTLFGLIILLALLAVFLSFYFLPTIIAGHRKHPNVSHIFLVNFVFGWTFLGWIAALVWGASSFSPGDDGKPVRICPQCSETVKAAAKICHFCRYQFPAEPAQNTAAPQTLTQASTRAFVGATAERKSKTSEKILALLMSSGFILIAIVAIFSFGNKPTRQTFCRNFVQDFRGATTATNDQLYAECMARDDLTGEPPR